MAYEDIVGNESKEPSVENTSIWYMYCSIMQALQQNSPPKKE